MQKEHGVLLPSRMPFWIEIGWPSVLLNICQLQEDRNIHPKKHHKIPFLRGCIAVFPLTNIQLRTAPIS